MGRAKRLSASRRPNVRLWGVTGLRIPDLICTNPAATNPDQAGQTWEPAMAAECRLFIHLESAPVEVSDACVAVGKTCIVSWHEGA